jgi:hypothetical protein
MLEQIHTAQWKYLSCWSNMKQCFWGLIQRDSPLILALQTCNAFMVSFILLQVNVLLQFFHECSKGSGKKSKEIYVHV